MSQWVRPVLDQAFAQAVLAIQKRAEKQLDWEKLAQTYVMTDLMHRARTTDSQLVLGRRGTGKTHLFRFLADQLGSVGQVAYYIDCTRLGSGYGSLPLPPEEIAPKYFRSLLDETAERLLDALLNMENPPPGIQDRAFDTLARGFATNNGSSSSQSLRPTFNYGAIARALETVLSDLSIQRFFVILDEWAQIPHSVQPYVAEYLKRSILSVPQISIKILAVSYQCQLSQQTERGIIGIQRGADIPDVIDFDGYFIYEENPGLVTEFFAQVLYNHVGAELGWDLDVGSEEKSSRVLDLFTQQPAFTELVRAAEGNCRDFLCIFSKSFFEGYKQHGGANAISIPHVRSAAASWFDNEKYANVRDEKGPHDALTFIINKVITGYKSRTFMVEASKSRAQVLTRLLNERILHKLSGFYSHRDRAGERYELFCVDYGAYVRFKGTVNEPYQSVMPLTSDLASLNDDERRYMVPLDDKRSIRRIVFDPAVLGIHTDQ